MFGVGCLAFVSTTENGPFGSALLRRSFHLQPLPFLFRFTFTKNHISRIGIFARISLRLLPVFIELVRPDTVNDPAAVGAHTVTQRLAIERINRELPKDISAPDPVASAASAALPVDIAVTREPPPWPVILRSDDRIERLSE